MPRTEPDSASQDASRWRVMLHLWPGLARLWTRGEWSALGMAIIFAVLLNGALVLTFVWPEMVSGQFRLAVWLAMAVVWAISIVFSLFDSQKKAVKNELSSKTDLFPLAQNEYLRGNWYDAEQLLLEQCREKPRDVATRLTLVSLYRRTGRQEMASKELAQIERLEAAEIWDWEIRSERVLLAQAENEEAEKETTDPSHRTEPDKTTDVVEKEPPVDG